MAATEIALGRELRPNETVDAGLSRTWTALWAIFLVALRLPFLATHNVQEDAYISLRCARNIALGLGYGFNAGERVNASTAHAFVFLASLVCRIFGTAYYIPVWQLMCTCFIVGAVYCIASAVSSSDRERDLMWILGSATPIAILISILALETSLLILLIAVLILDLRRPLPRLLPLLSIALLPWVRADAVAIGLIYLVCQVLRDRRPNWLNAAALAAGAGGILIFNRLYFGQWLNQSIVAKQSFRLVYPAPRAFFTNLQGLFLGLGREGIRNVFSPWRSEFVGHIEPLFSLVGLAACLWLARVAWRTRELRAPLTALLAVGFLMPIPYAWSNWLFHWYFHPSMFCFAMLVVLAVLKLGGIARPVLRPYILCAFALLLACLAAGQWAPLAELGDTRLLFHRRSRPPSPLHRGEGRYPALGACRVHSLLLRTLYLG